MTGRKKNEKFCTPITSCKAMTEILYRNSEKVFSNAKKGFIRFFSFNLKLLVTFSKAEIALAEAARAISAF